MLHINRLKILLYIIQLEILWGIILILLCWLIKSAFLSEHSCIQVFFPHFISFFPIVCLFPLFPGACRCQNASPFLSFGTYCFMSVIKRRTPFPDRVNGLIEDLLNTRLTIREKSINCWQREGAINLHVNDNNGPEKIYRVAKLWFGNEYQFKIEQPCYGLTGETGKTVTGVCGGHLASNFSPLK